MCPVWTRGGYARARPEHVWVVFIFFFVLLNYGYAWTRGGHGGVKKVLLFNEKGCFAKVLTSINKSLCKH